MPQRKTGITLECVICRISFYRPLSAFVHDNPKYCSQACWREASRREPLSRPNGRAEFSCCQCGKSSLVHKSIAGTRRFCSINCRDAFNRANGSPKRIERVVTQCAVCGTDVKRLECQRSDGRGKYCSRACTAAAVNALSPKVSKLETKFFEECERSGILVTRQVPWRGFVLDAIVTGTNIAVEFDGDYWHSTEAAKTRDKRKTAALLSRGMRLVRIPERIYLSNPEAAVKMVATIAGKERLRHA